MVVTLVVAVCRRVVVEVSHAVHAAAFVVITYADIMVCLLCCDKMVVW